MLCTRTVLGARRQHLLGGQGFSWIFSNSKQSYTLISKPYIATTVAASTHLFPCAGPRLSNWNGDPGLGRDKGLLRAPRSKNVRNIWLNICSHNSTPTTTVLHKPSTYTIHLVPPFPPPRRFLSPEIKFLFQTNLQVYFCSRTSNSHRDSILPCPSAPWIPRVPTTPCSI